jgi:energy-coupling factor transport system substrate-specific component
MSWQFASFAVLGLVLIGGFAWYERSRPPSQIVALVAALAALAVAGRLVLAPIPNVVATTDIVIFSGYALGGAPGFAVGALAGLISNFWLGQGPWTPWQMAGWGLAGVLGALLARATGRRAGRLELTLVCGFAGIAFGALLNFSLMVSYGGEVTMQRWLALEARAVPFDLAHAIGNVALALVAGPAMVRMLIRFRERFEFRWRLPERPAGAAGAGAGAALALLLAIVLAAPALAPRDATAQGAGAGWLQHARNDDGGFAATPGSDSNAQMTGWAMLGLESSGVNPRDLRAPTPVGYLRGGAGDLHAATDLSLAILALRGAGVDVARFGGRDLATELAAKQRRDGSFEGFPNATAFAVMALRSSGPSSGVARADAWLRRAQARDGGWGAAPGVASDADSTGAVLEAIGGGSRAARRGISYLRRSQLRSGGWALTEGAVPNSQSTAWAVQGLLAAGVSPSSVRKGGRSGLDFLSSRRAGDGHYRYSRSSDQTPVWVTAQALAAANQKPFPLAPVPRAARPAAVAGSPKRKASADGSRKGEASPLPNVFRTRAAHGQQTTAGTHRASRERGRGAPHPSTTTEPARNASARVPERAADAPGNDSGSPLVPIAIALGAAGLIVGGIWWASRRFAW